MLAKSLITLAILLTSLAFAAEEKIIIDIDGMTCNGCVNRVKTALSKVDGVESAEVTLKPGQAIVVYDDGRTADKVLVESITALGYKAQPGDVSAEKATYLETSAKKLTEKAEESSADQPAPATLTQTTGDKKESHVCPSINKCQELIRFHQAMHPLHMALAEKDLGTVCRGYPKLAKEAEAVKKMVCDEKCVKDVEAFESKRVEFLKTVEQLGKACKANDDQVLVEAFDKMHEAYIALGNLAK